MSSRSDLPTWKWLISYPLSTHECTSLVTSIFSDRDDVEAVGRLSGDDAQAFIEVIYEVGMRSITSEEWVG